MQRNCFEDRAGADLYYRQARKITYDFLCLIGAKGRIQSPRCSDEKLLKHLSN